MSISAESPRFDEDNMWVALSDGRTLGVALAWFPRLLHLTPEQRLGFQISRHGLHWEAACRRIYRSHGVGHKLM